VIYCGGGIISSGRGGRIEKVCRGGANSRDHDESWASAASRKRIRSRSAGWACTAAAFANWAVNGEYQLRKTFNDPMVENQGRRGICLLAFGVRFDDRVTGKFEEFLQARHDCSPGH